MHVFISFLISVLGSVGSFFPTGSIAIEQRPSLSMPKCRGLDIEELSIKELQHHLTSRTFTARDLTACYVERINLVNSYLRSAAYGAIIADVV